MKLAIQTARLPGESLAEKFSNARDYGFDGVEVNINPEFALADHVDELLAATDASGLPVAAICTHGTHDPLQPDPDERAERLERLTKMLGLIDRLGGAGIVCVPVRRPVEFPNLSEEELFEFAGATFAEWAAQLDAGSSALFFEPLNRYEASFLRRVEQGIALAERVKHPRVFGLADLFHMNIEEADMAAPIEAAGSLLGHVHIADNNRLQPGAGCLNLQPSFCALKRIGYQGWIAIECSALGGPLATEGPAAMLTETARYLRREWDRA